MEVKLLVLNTHFLAVITDVHFFIAWKDADHYRSLNYIEAMLNEVGMRQSTDPNVVKCLKELERVYQSITDVIVKIEAGD